MPFERLNRTISRRDALAIGTGVFVVLSVPFGLRRRPIPISRRSLPLMGTIAEIQVAHRDERLAQAAIGAGFAELRRVEALMTRFRGDSDIGRANSGAGQDGVVVSAETADVIEAALRWAAVSEGRFDPALGAVSELWDVTERHQPPFEAQVSRLARRGFWRKVDVSQTSRGRAIRFGDPEVRLDLGGIAKGHGIDRAVAALRARGVEHAIVTVGGDLYALGAAPGGDRWQVGIRDPWNPSGLKDRLAVADRAVTTSGDYERFFMWQGRRYHHLIDPATGAPRRTPVRSITVVGPDAINADAAATAAFGLDLADSQRLIDRMINDAEVRVLSA